VTRNGISKQKMMAAHCGNHDVRGRSSPELCILHFTLHNDMTLTHIPFVVSLQCVIKFIFDIRHNSV